MNKIIRLMTLLTVVSITSVANILLAQSNLYIPQSVRLNEAIEQRDFACIMRMKNFNKVIENVRCHLQSLLSDNPDYVITTSEAKAKFSKTLDTYFSSSKSEDEKKLYLELIGFSKEDFCLCLKNLYELQIDAAIHEVQVYFITKGFKATYKDVEKKLLEILQQTINISHEDPLNNKFAKYLGFDKNQFNDIRLYYLKLLFVEKQCKNLKIPKYINPQHFP